MLTVLDNTDNNEQNQIHSLNFNTVTVCVFAVFVVMLSTLTSVLLNSYVVYDKATSTAGIILPVLAAGLLTVLTERSKNIFIAILFSLLPVAGAAISLAYVASPVYALAALIPLTLAAPVCVSLNADSNRSAGIAGGATLTAILLFVMFGLFVYEKRGVLSIEALDETVNVILQPLTDAMKQTVTQISEQYEYAEAVLDPEQLIGYIKYILAGAVGAGAVVMSYFGTLAARLIYNTLGLRDALPISLRITVRRKISPEGVSTDVTKQQIQWRIGISNITAILFCISVFLPLAGGMFAELPLPLEITALNLMLILSPVFLYCGIRDIAISFSPKTRGSSPTGCLSPVLLMITLFIMPAYMPVLLELFGVTSVFRENKMNRIAAEDGIDFEDDGDDSDDSDRDD